MARLRFMAAALLALTFAGNSIPMGRTQTEPSDNDQTPKLKIAADDSWVIYSLTDMGYDADLGKWIAETVPEMIEPSSWKAQGGMGAIRYYAPKNILIVKQTQAIQKKIDAFLKDLKASTPKASAVSTAEKRMPHAGIVAADCREPALLRTSNPANELSSYPVPAAVKPPKHLFHFIIRYEGDGIIDDNVVKFMKAQLQGGKPPVPTLSVSPSPVALPTPPGAGGPPAANVTPPSPPAYGAPNTPDSSDTAPSVAPEQPSPAPNKKKGKRPTAVAPTVR
jgi:hypothetical protein